MIWLRSRLLTVINEAIRLPMVRSFRRAYRNVFGFHDDYWRKRFGTGEPRQYRTDPQTEPEARFGQRRGLRRIGKSGSFWSFLKLKSPSCRGP